MELPEIKLLKKHPSFLVEDGKRQRINDWVAVEWVYELYLNERLVDTPCVSPLDLEAHAVGYLVTEGLVSPEEILLDEVRCEGERVFVRTRNTCVDAPYESKGMVKSCKIPITNDDTSRNKSQLTIASPLILECARQINEMANGWKKSGGVHISLLFDRKGKLIKVAEDIGRHNTVDKVVGYAFLHKIPLHETILACSGRQPEGMVLKIARAGIPVVITKGAVTDKGIATAERLGVTLIGFARAGRFTIYAHPESVQVGLSTGP